MVLAASLVTSILAASKNLALDAASITDVTNIVLKSSSCCSALTSGFSNKTSTQGQSIYKKSLTAYWSNQEADIAPTCLLTPTSAQDVAKAVAILSLGSIAYGDSCKFAIKGGGHSPFAGFANIAKGVTIDLATLNEVTLSSDKSSVEIGPGAKWGDVYLPLDEAGVATQGGRVASVGVPGLLIGGGISFFSGEHGFACDSVQSFEVVLANGNIVNASSTSNPDLFLALKGGSNNFGIVTKFTMSTFPQGKFWGGNIGHPIPANAYMPALQAFAASQDDPNAALMSTFSISQSQPFWLIISSLEYTKSDPVDTNPAAFANFTHFPSIFNTMRVSNLTDFATELDSNTPYGYRQLFATITISPDLAAMEEIFSLANQTALSLLAQNVTGLSFDLLYEPLAQSTLPASSGTNSLGLTKSNGNLIVVLLDCMWSDSKDDNLMHSSTKTLINNMKKKAGKSLSNFEYLNYASTYQTPLQGYGSAAVSSLQKAAKKYDPNGMFQKMVPGGFKLPSS